MARTSPLRMVSRQRTRHLMRRFDQPRRHDWPFAAQAFSAALLWLAGRLGTAGMSRVRRRGSGRKWSRHPDFRRSRNTDAHTVGRWRMVSSHQGNYHLGCYWDRTSRQSRKKCSATSRINPRSGLWIPINVFGSGSGGCLRSRLRRHHPHRATFPVRPERSPYSAPCCWLRSTAG